jgi:hypothetical protein
MLFDQLADIAWGAAFLFVGLIACVIAAIVRRSETRIAWLRIWSALYGAAQFSQSRAFVAVWSGCIQNNPPYASAVITYVVVFPSLLAFRERSLGRLRFLI